VLSAFKIVGQMPALFNLIYEAFPDAYNSQVDQFRRNILNESSFIAESRVSESRQKRPGKPATLYSLREWADPTKDLEQFDTDSD
jgi:hypothetical protein